MHRENVRLSGRRALETLLAPNKRLTTAYRLKESFGQLWGLWPGGLGAPLLRVLASDFSRCEVDKQAGRCARRTCHRYGSGIRTLELTMADRLFIGLSSNQIGRMGERRTGSQSGDRRAGEKSRLSSGTDTPPD